MSVCTIHIYVYMYTCQNIWLTVRHNAVRVNGQGQVLVLLGPAIWLDSQSHNQLCITELLKYFYDLCDILIKICIVQYQFCRFCIFMAYSKCCCHSDQILDPQNVFHTQSHIQIMQVCVCVWVCVCVCAMYVHLYVLT